jgi:HPt (histidine-containing phosphotransfer) domain-containing protein
MLLKYLPKELVELRRMDEMVPAASQQKKEKQGSKPVRSENTAEGVAASVETESALSGNMAERVQTEAVSESVSAERVQTEAVPDSEAAAVEDAVSVPTDAASDLPFMERLKAIGELDTSVGMSYCMDNEEFYQEMLKEYLNSGKAEAMTQYFAAQDWENYRIIVHALKSTSLTIGAVELSEQAKALEMACKENNITYVQDNHAKVLERYEKFVGALQGALDV